MDIINKIKIFCIGSIRRQLILGVVIVHAVLMSIFVYDLANRQQDFLHKQALGQAHSLAETLAANSVSWVLSNDVVGLEEILHAQKKYPDLKYAMVLGLDGKVLGHTDPDKLGLYMTDDVSRKIASAIDNIVLVNQFDLIDVASPVFSNNKLIAWSRVGLSNLRIKSALNMIVRDSLFYIFFAIIIGAFFAFFMSRSITKSLVHLVDVAQGIKEGDYTLRSNLKRNDELGVFSDTLNLMLNAVDKGRRDLQAIMDNIPAVVYIKDTKGRFTFINRQFEGLFGLSRKDVVGQVLHDIFPKDVADHMLENDRAVLQAKHALESEEIAPQDDGEHIYASVKFPLLSRDGDVYAVCGISTDITQRKGMEKETQRLLAMKEAEQREIIDSMLDAVITINENGIVLSFNKAAEVLFGYQSDEIIGNDADYIMPKPFSNLAIKHEYVMGVECEVEGRRKNNDVFPMRLSVAELPKDSNGLRRFIGSCADLTQLKMQEEQLLRSQKMDALGKLTGGIAHDYNNMLGVMMGYAELLGTSLIKQPKLLAYIGEILRAGERGSQLTKKLLAFSKKGDSFDDISNVLDINVLLRDAQHMLEKILTARIRTTFDLSNVLWNICIDNNELEDVLINLAINAMHAIEGNGEVGFKTYNEKLNALNAHVLGLEEGDYVVLVVNDNGCGIDKESKEKIFEPFYTTKGDAGTGLGLTQVYGFVERSGGAIKVSSALGFGTKFQLYFPRYTEINVVNMEGSSKTIDTKGSERLLVVDDEPALLEVTSVMLSQQGYEVLRASNGQQALEILSNFKVDLLLSDVIMPDMGGYQLAAIVAEQYPAIKIQLASGYDDEKNMDLVDEELKKNLLFKPYKAKDLLVRLRELLG